MYIITIWVYYKFFPVIIKKTELEILKSESEIFATKFLTKKMAQEKLKELKKDKDMTKHKFRIKKTKFGSSFY